MRNVNIFRTHVTDHIIPSEIMRRAIVLSPGKDWTDQKTEAYKYLKRWALEQDERIPGKKQGITGVTKEEARKLAYRDFEGHEVPIDVVVEAKKLSPKSSMYDRRTKAYKYLKRWALEQDNNENSK